MYIDKNLVVSGTYSTAGVWTGQTIESTELSTYSIDLAATKDLSISCICLICISPSIVYISLI